LNLGSIPTAAAKLATASRLLDDRVAWRTAARLSVGGVTVRIGVRITVRVRD
jgi:hypothetical protein